MRKVSALALVLGLVACERAPTLLEFTDQQASVHALLRAGDDSAAVLLTRARSSTGLLDDAVTEPIAGASVRLSFDGTTVTLVPDPAADRCVRAGSPPGSTSGAVDPALLRPACYVAEIPGGIRGGQTYDLWIEQPDGPVVRGTATVPAAPTIRTPDPGFSIAMDDPADPMLVTWTLHEPAPRVELALQPARPDCRVLLQRPGFFGSFSLDVTALDSVGVNVASVNCNTTEGRDAESWDAELVITAFDSTYARYIHEVTSGESVRKHETTAGLTGAIGVFAAAATARLPVVIHR